MTPFEKHGINEKNKRPVILDTDWGTDCDDCVCLRILCRAHKEGIIDLRGININTCVPASVPSLHSFITAEGTPDIPIGIDFDSKDYIGVIREDSYQDALTHYGSGNYKSNSDAEDGVRLYRKILAAANEKVDIVSVGFMQILGFLLESGGDDISPKTGVDLVREKVNALWAMAGKWDVPNGREYNFNDTQRAIIGGRTVCDKWPTPIYFLGVEVGDSVISGGNSVLTDENDCLRIAMAAHGSQNGRSSWDPLTAVLMLCGVEKAGYVEVRGTATLDENGANNFTQSADGKHCYVKKTKPDEWYAEFVNDLIV